MSGILDTSEGTEVRPEIGLSCRLPYWSDLVATFALKKLTRSLCPSHRGNEVCRDMCASKLRSQR